MKRPGRMIWQVLSSASHKAATLLFAPGHAPRMPRYRGKLAFDATRCIGCKLCMKDCPTNAINIRKVGEKQFEADVDMSMCIYCAQCVDTCPKKALSATTEFELAALDRPSLKVTYRNASVPAAQAPSPAVAVAAPVAEAKPSTPLAAEMASLLKGAKRVAILAVGSELRGDDSAGLLAGQALQEACAGKTSAAVFMGHTAPENLLGEIRQFGPSHLVVIDAADMGKAPGEISVIHADNASGSSFSTHTLPMKVMADYVRQSIGSQVLIVGIQPASTEFGHEVSESVVQAARTLAAAIASAIGA